MPGNRQVFSTAMNAADRYRWDSQWAEAASEYERALAEFPDDAAARGGLGFCYMQTKQWQQALDEYEHILKRDPSNVIALSKTAELYVILNRREDAYKAYLHLAELYSQAGQGGRAEAAWQKAVQLSPGNPEPHERLATYYMGKKDMTLMIAERLAAAQGYLQRNDFIAARMQCEEVLHVDATNTQAQYLLSQMMRGQVQPSGSLSGGQVTIPQGMGTAGTPSAGTMVGTPSGGQGTPTLTGTPSGPRASGNPTTDTGTLSNISGGNTGIMGNMGSLSGGQASAGNMGGMANPGPTLAAAGMANGGTAPTSRKRITASQVTEALKQAQTFQAQGRFTDAIDLCEQILESGFDRPDARYFLGWLYQEQRRWDDAIRQFQMLLNDPDYALSCYYALGQCYRARGDMRTATMHFDEAVDRVNLDALTVEESDQLVQLCQEAAEAHRLMGEQDQALTVYNALLGFLRSRGWNDKVAQVEFMLKQAQNSPMPARPITPPPTGTPPSPQGQAQGTASTAQQQGNSTRVLPPEQMASQQQPPYAPSSAMPEVAYNMGMMPNMQPPAPVPPMGNGNTQTAASNQSASLAPIANSTLGELPDWLTGILNDADKTQIAHKQASQSSAPPVQPLQGAQSLIASQPTTEQPVPSASDMASLQAGQATVPSPSPSSPAPSPASPSWLTEGAKQAGTAQPLGTVPGARPEVEVTAKPSPSAVPPLPVGAGLVPAQPSTEGVSETPPSLTEVRDEAVLYGSQPSASAAARSVGTVPGARPESEEEAEVPETAPPVGSDLSSPPPIYWPAGDAAQAPLRTAAQGSRKKAKKSSAEDLLSQIAGSSGKDEALKQVADAVLASTATLPDNIRMQVVQAMQDIQRYIDHGLLSPATEECLRVIDMAPQYLDIHQVLCEIYVRQGKVEQAITKYAILIDTYVVNGRVDDAIATYRRILQLEPNNLTYRVRLISLLASQGNKEDLLRERTLAAESYLRLGYMDRALTELEQALQESPTSVPTRLNYALALQKLGRSQQAVAEYQRVLQVDPRNITALVRWHIAMITGIGSGRATTLEVLSRVRWQLRGEGQKHYESVVREYTSASETYPNNPDIHFALGQIHQQAGNFDKAIDAYQLARRDSSYEVLARVSSAQCLLTQGKLEAAISQLEQALQSVRRSPAGAVDPSVWAARPREEDEEHQAPEVEVSMLLAKMYGRAGRQEQMQAILRQVKRTTPYKDEVASALAEISARQGDIDSALQEYFDLVRHYRSKRQVDNALSVLNEMVRMAPQDPRAHGELGDIYISRGLLEEGIAELRLLADIHLRNNQLEQAAEAYRRIGNIYAEMDDTEEAFANLRRAAELVPDDLNLLREVIGYCCQIGRTKEATKYQVVIARHYYDTQQVKESVAALQQLIALDRNNYEAYDMLGQTYQSVGEYEQASRVYKNLAKVNPDSSTARERLVALQELRTKSA